MHTSYLQRLGARQGGFRYLLPLFPRAIERLPVRGYDRASSRAAAPSRTASAPAPGALHVCYCHSPFRYAWFERERALARGAADRRGRCCAGPCGRIRALGPAGRPAG